MKLNFEAYKDKVRACWIGKNIGGTMGGPFEGRRELLNVTGFVTEAGEPLPNDDLDLQLVWLHALEQLGPTHIDAASLGELWLNYIPPHWNEYGNCKANMQRGLRPSLAGDVDSSWSHSNGAWIRTEIWACSAPGIPELAAKYSIEDAKVDHGAGEGTPAAAFVAAMQSAAFALKSLEECIEVGLTAIPSTSRVAQSIRLVLDYYKNGKTWVEARNAVLEQNADIGNGWFEAPSNVAYVIIGLIYGEGDFKKSMLTAINCGDDTDCTAATVGATLGILYGTKGIPADWSEYIGDKIITISLSCGGLGRIFFPQTCTELTDRVVALAPFVVYSYNRRYRTIGYHRKNKNPMTLSNDPDEIPENICELYKENVTKFFKPELETLNPYSMHFEETVMVADVTLSEPVIAPMGEVKVHIDFKTTSLFERKPYTASLRWILPDGFSAEGRRSLFIPDVTAHTENITSYDFTIKAGEQLSSENRVILEVTPHGRHTAMYISFVLLG